MLKSTAGRTKRSWGKVSGHCSLNELWEFGGKCQTIIEPERNLAMPKNGNYWKVESDKKNEASKLEFRSLFLSPLF